MKNLIKERYKITKVLDSNNYCQTFLAQDKKQAGSHKCIVEHLSNSTDRQSKKHYCLQKLFAKKIELLKKLNSVERVPKLIDFFEAKTGFFFVQEYISGHSLLEELQQKKQWSETQVTALLIDVLEVLKFVHRLGLVHCDIKPSNLIRCQSDKRIALIGFASVKQVWAQVTNSVIQELPAALLVGTPGYMPKEQGKGEPRFSSDIYALGMVAIQALTGNDPKQVWENAATGEIVWQHQAKNVSPELVQVLTKMVHPQCTDRYSSATEVLQALQCCVHNSTKTETKLINPTANNTVKISSFTIGIIMGLATGVALLLALYYSLSSSKNKLAASLPTDVEVVTTFTKSDRS